MILSATAAMILSAAAAAVILSAAAAVMLSKSWRCDAHRDGQHAG
jgi:hypothetical protein